MDQTLAAVLNGVGVVGLVILIGWLMWTGRLIAKPSVDELRQAYDRQLEDSNHDRDEWRAAHRISETARVEEREHNAALIEDIAKPMQEFLFAFRQRADEARKEGDQT